MKRLVNLKFPDLAALSKEKKDDYIQDNTLADEEEVDNVSAYQHLAFEASFVIGSSYLTEQYTDAKYALLQLVAVKLIQHFAIISNMSLHSPFFSHSQYQGISILMIKMQLVTHPYDY